MTCIPHSEKKLSTPSGETLIPRNRKKKRLLLNGIKKPTPLPPEVIASRIPCDTVDRKTTKNHIVFFRLPIVNININDHNKANKIECVNPL